jgi:hypothetical protein
MWIISNKKFLIDHTNYLNWSPNKVKKAYGTPDNLELFVGIIS